MEEEKKTAAVAETAEQDAKTAGQDTETAGQGAKAAKAKKRKKWFVRIAVGLVVFLVALVMFLWLLLDWTVATTVRNVAPVFTGTEVELKSVSIGIFSGQVELKGFKVANPKGFAHKYAFELDKFICRVDLTTVLTDKIIVEEVTIDGMLADYEMSLNGSNLAQIQKNVESTLGIADSKSADSDAKAKDQPAKANPKVVIRKLSVSGIKLASGVIKLPLPPITLTDLGENTLGEVIDKFYVALMKSVGSALSGEAFKGIGNAVSDAGKSMSDGIKNLFNSKK